MIKIDNFFDYLENLSKVKNFSIDLIEIEKLRSTDRLNYIFTISF